MEKITHLKKFELAMAQLKKAMAEPETLELSIDGTIQRFEFSFELGWKALKDTLHSAEGIEAKSPKAALKEAYALEWITEETLWLNMLEDRNNASHTYDKTLAKIIYTRIKNYYPELYQLMRLLQEKQPHA